MAKVLVVCGGDNSERRVSLEGGDAVAEGLEEAGHEVMKLDTAAPERIVDASTKLLEGPVGETPPEEAASARLDRAGWLSLVRAVASAGADAVFPILHGSWGEDGRFQALLELLGLPWLGSGVLPSGLAMDKAETKLRALRLGLPLPDAWHCRSLEQVEAALPEAVGADPEGRLVVKPNHGGSSTGMAITADREQAVDVARRTLEDGDTVLVESYIPGREITVALLDGEPYPVLEIAPHSGFYDYTNKYTKGRTEYLCPAPLDEGVAKLVREMAKTIHDDIGCRHLARVDFRLAGETDAMLLEVNTMPGMTALSLVPMAAASRGTDFPGLMDLFVRWTLRDAQPGRGVRED